MILLLARAYAYYTPYVFDLTYTYGLRCSFITDINYLFVNRAFCLVLSLCCFWLVLRFELGKEGLDVSPPATELQDLPSTRAVWVSSARGSVLRFCTSLLYSSYVSHPLGAATEICGVFYCAIIANFWFYFCCFGAFDGGMCFVGFHLGERSLLCHIVSASFYIWQRKSCSGSDTLL